MPLGLASEAACMAAPRSATTRKRIVEIDRAGEEQGRVFAQAQTSGELAILDFVGLLFIHDGQSGDGRDEQRRLAVVRGIQVFRLGLRSKSSPGRSRECGWPGRR